MALRQLRFVLSGAPVVVDDGAEHVRIRAEVTTLRGVVGVLLGSGSWVQVREPAELRTLMREVAQEVLDGTS